MSNFCTSMTGISESQEYCVNNSQGISVGSGEILDITTQFITHSVRKSFSFMKVSRDFQPSVSLIEYHRIAGWMTILEEKAVRGLFESSTALLFCCIHKNISVITYWLTLNEAL